MERNEKISIGMAIAATIAAGLLHRAEANVVLTFVITALALALLAVIVGDATEQLGSKLGPGATGILQSGWESSRAVRLHLRAARRLTDVVKARWLARSLATRCWYSGSRSCSVALKNGRQVFRVGAAKMIVTLLMLAVAALMMPSLAKELHAPAEQHIEKLDWLCRSCC
jgi:Ca2+:H+ antiporter